MSAAQSPAAPALERQLAILVEGDRGWNDFALDVECQSDVGPRNARLFGSGLGVWGDETQFAIDRGALRAVVRELLAAEFAKMPETFGGDQKGARALGVLCLLRVRTSTQMKEVRQLDRGRQSAEFKRLANGVLDTLQPLHVNGRRADTVEDGLIKITAGDLAAELLTVTAQYRPEARGEQGWKIALDGLRLEVQSLTNGGFSSPRSFRLDRSAARALARALLADFAPLPANVDMGGYLDLRVEVLKHGRAVQARRFANPSAEVDRTRVRRLIGALTRVQK